MAVQKAVALRNVGKPCILVDDYQVPEPKKGQVQIKGKWTYRQYIGTIPLLIRDLRPLVSVAGLNPHDQKCRDIGLIIQDNFPAILAKDVVGRISKLGDGVTGFAVGDRVMSLAGVSPGFPQGGLQEYALADTINLAKIPESTTDDEAASIPTNLCSVFAALFQVLKLPSPWAQDGRSPDQLLIVGGGSNCGQFAVQLAKLAGIQKIIIVGGDENQLIAHGATHVIDRHGAEDVIVRKIRDVVGDILIYALDTVNMPQGLSLALNALSTSNKGKLARLLPIGTVDEQTAKGHEILDVFGNMHFRDPLSLELWERLPSYIEKGSIRPTAYSVRQGLTAEVVNAALDEYRDGKKVVKPHIHI